jgi:hypothetical protein
MAKNQQQHKEEEKKSLIQFADDNNLWVENIDIGLYISQGAEQKVYLKDGATVLKLNDAIYYASWIDYFHSLLLNNLFFSDTAYKLLGFYKDLDDLYAVVEQPFVKANEKTDLKNAVRAVRSRYVSICLLHYNSMYPFSENSFCINPRIFSLCLYCLKCVSLSRASFLV